MKPGYKKKAISSNKKLAKQKRKDAKKPEFKLLSEATVVDDVEPAAMDVDEEVVTKPVSRREKKKREVLKVKKQKLKTDLLKKTTIKQRYNAARGISGATNLALSSVGSRQLQQAQKQTQLAGTLKATLKAVGVDVDMKLA